MDAQNYVGREGDQFVVVIGGQIRGRYNTQQEAENAYNTMGGPGSTTSTSAVTPSTTPSVADSTDPGLQKLLDAAASGNREQFEEAVREFNATHTLAQQQQYASLVTTLLSTAAGLTGPEDWLKYNAAMSGGRNIYEQLYGGQAVPGFASPTGSTQPLTIDTILQQLGISSGGQAGTTTGVTASMSEDQALDYIWANQPGLEAFFKGNGWDVSTPEKQRAAAREWLKIASEDWVNTNGRDPVKVATYMQQNAQTATSATSGTDVTTPSTGSTGDANWATGAAGNVTPVTSVESVAYPGAGVAPGFTDFENAPNASSTIPYGYQVNPAVWDSLTDNAKKMALAAAEAGKTPGGYVSASDYLAQIYAARPRGASTRRTGFNWSSLV